MERIVGEWNPMFRGLWSEHGEDSWGVEFDVKKFSNIVRSKNFRTFFVKTNLAHIPCLLLNLSNAISNLGEGNREYSSCTITRDTWNSCSVPSDHSLLRSPSRTMKMLGSLNTTKIVRALCSEAVTWKSHLCAQGWYNIEQKLVRLISFRYNHCHFHLKLLCQTSLMSHVSVKFGKNYDPI